MILSPLSAAILATLLMYLLTALGAALVFPLRRFHPSVMNLLMALGAGIMLAASYFSLLAPALTSAHSLRQSPLLMCSGGFLLGGLLVLLADALLSRWMRRTPLSDVRRRTVLLIGSITLHNIPEGLAVGVAFGAAASGAPEASIAGAMTLMFGMGLQNIPEGVAVSVPLLREGFSKNRAFFFGQLSGIVEPIAAVFGALVVGIAEPILPFALAFAAGAMIFVVVEEVIPESHASGHGDAASLGVIIGFVVMMCLDVALA